jgi:hypothetical protein
VGIVSVRTPNRVAGKRNNDPRGFPMRTSPLLRFAVVAVAAAVLASPAAGYIHFPPTTLPKMCQQSSHIRVLKVTKFDTEKGVIVYEAAETLKDEPRVGPTEKKSFRHAVRGEPGPIKPILDWAGAGKTAVMFTIEWPGHACGYVFLDEFCYSVDYNAKGDFWLLIRVDPELSATYHGTAERLRGVARDLLAGKPVEVPVKPGAKPLTLKEREKLAPALSEILVKNREK